MHTAEATEQTDYYLLGYWANPYRAQDREHFWMGPFDSRAEAAAAGKRKQERGQPKRFVNWCKGANKAIAGREKFAAQAHKAGMNPRPPSGD